MAENARTPKDNGTAALTDTLRTYATRGVFRDLSVKQTAASTEYRFTWLTPRPVKMKYSPKTKTLLLSNLLPDIAPRSRMDKELRAFVEARFSKQLPEHRRLSSALLQKLTCVNRRRSLSIRMKLGSRDPATAVRQAVRLISEIFQNFLAGPYHEYMVRNFDLRED